MYWQLLARKPVKNNWLGLNTTKPNPEQTLGILNFSDPTGTTWDTPPTELAEQLYSRASRILTDPNTNLFLNNPFYSFSASDITGLTLYPLRYNNAEGLHCVTSTLRNI